MDDPTEQIIAATMANLMREFGLTVVGSRSDASFAEVSFANGWVGLKVAIEWRELRPFLQICQLEAGRLPPQDQVPDVGTDPQCFDVDSLLNLRQVENSPVGKMLPSREPVAAIPLLRDYADALTMRARDVFEGDPAVFEELRRIVARRREAIRGG